MANHAILRLDNVTGTTDGARLFSGKFYAGNVAADIDNGLPVEIGALITGEREIRKCVAATAETTSWGIVSTPELDSTALTNTANLGEFYNKAGNAIRVHVLKDHNIFSVSAEALATVPTVGQFIALGGTGGKWAVGNSGVAKCIAIDVVDGVNLYVFEIGVDVANQ